MMKLVLLVMIILHQHIQCFVGAFYGVCNLQSVPMTNITLPYNYGIGDEADNRRRRLFLHGPVMNAIALTPHGARTTNQRRTHSNNNSSSSLDREISATVNLQMIESRLCDPRLCVMNYHQLLIDDEFYCPVPTNYCNIIQSPYDRNVSVTCSYYQGWKVLFVRSSWYYICWMTLLFTVLFCCTPAGHHTIRYPISRCFSKFNLWVTEHLLQVEISSRNQIRNEFDEALRIQRRTEGWISGYSIKTKIYSRGIDDTAAVTNEEIDAELYCDANSAPTTVDQTVAKIEDTTQKSVTQGYDSMCTICLLELEVGDRVADLSCGHLYHADCLGEWIIKKNSCPLCQSLEIAKEIRTFHETNDNNDGGITDSNSESRLPSESRLVRFRRRIYDKFIDLATGRATTNRHRSVMLQHRLNLHGQEQPPLEAQEQQPDQDEQRPRRGMIGLQSRSTVYQLIHLLREQEQELHRQQQLARNINIRM